MDADRADLRAGRDPREHLARRVLDQRCGMEAVAAIADHLLVDAAGPEKPTAARLHDLPHLGGITAVGFGPARGVGGTADGPSRTAARGPAASTTSMALSPRAEQDVRAAVFRPTHRRVVRRHRLVPAGRDRPHLRGIHALRLQVTDDHRRALAGELPVGGVATAELRADRGRARRNAARGPGALVRAPPSGPASPGMTTAAAGLGANRRRSAPDASRGKQTARPACSNGWATHCEVALRSSYVRSPSRSRCPPRRDEVDHRLAADRTRDRQRRASAAAATIISATAAAPAADSEGTLGGRA